jgi:hypothetical protein
MKLINASELSRQAGVSREAIRKAIKANTINYSKGKLIDLEDELTILYIQKIKNRKSGKKSDIENARKPKKKKTKVESAKSVPADSEVVETEETKIATVNENEYVEKHKLQCDKLKEDIEKIQIANAKARNDLIDKNFVVLIFNKIYSIDQNEFLQLKDVLTEKICNVAGINEPKLKLKIAELTNKELYKTQNHIKIEIDKFLDKLEAENENQ